MTTCRLTLRRACGFLVLLCTLFCAPDAPAVETVTHIHSDAFGNPMVATDQAGNVIWRQSYKPFGAPQSNNSNGNRLGFHGKEVDAETGLSYFGARYYDPVVGRFMGVDGVGFDEQNPHSFNKYAYGNNNPYRFSDRAGKAPTPIDAAFLGYDLGRLIYETATGGDARGAATDLSISAAAIMVPVPGAALGMKMVRGAEATRAAEHAAGLAKNSGKAELVIGEALSGKGNFTSQHTLKAEELLAAGESFLGKGYSEIGKPGSGVFRSADGTRQFRIDDRSITGKHAPNVPHGHLETLSPGVSKPSASNHIPFLD